MTPAEQQPQIVKAFPDWLRWLAILTGCVTGLAGSLVYGVGFLLPPSVLVIGACIQPYLPPPGRWALLIGAMLTSVLAFLFLAPPVLGVFWGQPRHLDLRLLGLFSLFALSVVLVAWCDVAILSWMKGSERSSAGRIALITVVTVVVLVSAWQAYAQRLRIETRIWHWRHGYEISVGNYEVPVPGEWYPQLSHDDEVILTNTSTDLQRNSFLPPSIMISSNLRPQDAAVFDTWKSAVRKGLESHGDQVVEENTFQAGSLTVACLADNSVKRILHLATDFVSVRCISTGSIGFSYEGPTSGLPEFHAVASGTRERK